jgi:hypothetical protein
MPDSKCQLGAAQVYASQLYKACYFMSKLVERYTMYVQGEYDEERKLKGAVKQLKRDFLNFFDFRTATNTWDKYFACQT